MGCFLRVLGDDIMLMHFLCAAKKYALTVIDNALFVLLVALRVVPMLILLEFDCRPTSNNEEARIIYHGWPLYPAALYN